MAEHRKIWKQGDSSYGLTLPKEMCEELDINIGTWVTAKIKGNKIEIAKSKDD